MFEAIAAFFRRLFGSSPEETVRPESAAQPPAPEVPAIESVDRGLPDPDEFPEDGGDVFSEAIGETVELPEEVRTRSLDPVLEVGEVEDRTGETTSSEAPVMITAPRYLWCLDNGHGKLQSGKRSPHFADGTQFEEWEFNRAIVRGIIAELEPRGLMFYNVVPEDEIGRFLSGRVKRANNRQSDLGLPKIFVSVHANAARLEQPDQFRNDIEGLETFHFPGSTTGKKLARVFQKHLVQTLGWRDRGVKSANFYVLANTSMPAVLTENGFYTSEPQARDLLDPAIRKMVIDAHCEAILEIEQKGLENLPS